MPGSPALHRRRRCRGAVLLAALVPALLFGGGALLHRLEADGPSRRIEDERTRRALARAKEVLLDYAFSDPNRPGELPCPDLDGDGRLMLGVDFRGGRDVPCASLRGWLPFRSLGVEELRDGAGERLWYAVSDIHHAGHSAPLNSEVAGQLSVDGAGDVAAVIIAPGFPVDEGQARARDEGASAPRRAPARLRLSRRRERGLGAGTLRDSGPAAARNERSSPGDNATRALLGRREARHRRGGARPGRIPPGAPDAALARAARRPRRRASPGPSGRPQGPPRLPARGRPGRDRGAERALAPERRRHLFGGIGGRGPARERGTPASSRGRIPRAHRCAASSARRRSTAARARG